MKMAEKGMLPVVQGRAEPSKAAVEVFFPNAFTLVVTSSAQDPRARSPAWQSQQRLWSTN